MPRPRAHTTSPLSSMSLIIAQPFRSDFVNRFPHEFDPGKSLVKSQSSPTTRRTTPLLESSLKAISPKYEKMTTPHTHRGLPPMNLPDLNRPGPGPPSLSQPLGAMPAPPTQWQGQEDSMRNWLLAKAEEDKRKQEEERTRQESLKLEQRKIEQSMLRESLQGGVPPTMVPMIYAGIGGGNLSNVSVDWLQQYTSQLQLQQQQLQRSSPDVHRSEGRLMGPLGSNPYPLTQPTTQQQQYPAIQPIQQQVLQSHAPEQQPPPPSGPIQTTFSAYQPPPVRQPPTSDPRSSATRTQLPRLTTNEMYSNQPPQPAAPPVHPLQQSQTVQQQAQQPASSPSIYFHHWVPPNEARTTTSTTQPQTPAAKAESQHSAHPSSSNVGENDHRESPRKRKAQGAHQANPPPSTGPQYTSPSFSTTSSVASGRKGGQRSRAFSNVSAIGRDSDSRHSSRPPSSHRRDDGSTQQQRSSQVEGNGHENHDGHHNGADDLLRSTERALEEKPQAGESAPGSSDGKESREEGRHMRTRSR